MGETNSGLILTEFGRLGCILWFAIEIVLLFEYC